MAQKDKRTDETAEAPTSAGRAGEDVAAGIAAQNGKQGGPPALAVPSWL